MSLRSFELPPVRDAVVISRRAPIGPKALLEALEHISPGMYQLLPVDRDELIEGIIIRKRNLKVLTAEQLRDLLLEQARQLMDDSGTLHVELDLQVNVQVDV